MGQEAQSLHPFDGGAARRSVCCLLPRECCSTCTCPAGLNYCCYYCFGDLHQLELQMLVR
jgi:hypothetical protein